MNGILRRAAIPTAALVLTAGCSSTTAKPSPAHTAAPSTTITAPATAPSTATGPGSTTPPAAAQISIADFAFSPANLTVHPGQTVTVINHDSTTHTLTAATGNAFDTGAVNPGKSATFTAPATAGTYPYVCSIHASMHGTLTVG